MKLKSSRTEDGFFSIPSDKRAEFLDLVASNEEIKVESFLPIQEELASVLFRTAVSP